MTTRTAQKNQSICLGFIILVAFSGLCTIFGPVVTAAEAWQQHAPPPADSPVDRLTASAQSGDAAAQLHLGMRYYEGGRGHPADYDEALKWFHLAADQGNAEAQARIGMMYHFGKGEPRDDTEAARWYLLAANGDYAWAQLQLSDMYGRGVGVPRDHQESKKWLARYSAHHPDHSTAFAWQLFAVAILAVIAFSLGLLALQRSAIKDRRRFAIGVFVHVAGTALVLNTLITYGFPIVFPNCSHNYLATACTQINDPQTRKFVNELADWSVVNLIFRFMAGAGFVLDGLAVWYVVYLCRLLFKRVLPDHGTSRIPPSVPVRNL
jgi:hypothetical protein